MTSMPLPPYTRDQYIEIVSKIICITAGIAPVEPSDGGPNWWMFREDVTPLVDSLIERKIFQVKP